MSWKEKKDSNNNWFEIKYTILSVLLSCAPIVLALYLIKIKDSNIRERLEIIEQKELSNITLSEEEKEFKESHDLIQKEKVSNKAPNHSNKIFRPRPKDKR